MVENQPIVTVEVLPARKKLLGMSLGRSRAPGIKPGMDLYVSSQLPDGRELRRVMEGDTQLGHASCLQSGQRVPEGKHFHGTPAQETGADYCAVEPMNCTALRRWLYTIALAVPGFTVLTPLGIMVTTAHQWLGAVLLALAVMHLAWTYRRLSPAP